MIQQILQYLIFLTAISFVFWLLLEVTKTKKIIFFHYLGFVCFILMIIFCFTSLLNFGVNHISEEKETYEVIIIQADTLYRKK